MIQAKSTRTQWNTGIDGNLLKYIGMKSVDVPEQFVSMLRILFQLINSYLTASSYHNCSITYSKASTTNRSWYWS